MSTRFEQIVAASRPDEAQQYRFFLRDHTGTATHLIYSPDGFTDGEIELKRNKTYRGVTRTLVVNELVFYKDGAEWIKRHFWDFGMEAEGYLDVEIYDNGQYIPYISFMLDFATYLETDISVKIQVIGEALWDIIKNREDIEINLFRTVSIDGQHLPTITPTLWLRDTSVNLGADWDKDPNNIQSPPSFHVVPAVVQGGNFPEARDYTQNAGSKAGAIFYESQKGRKLNIHVHVSGSIDALHSDSSNQAMIEIYINVYDINDNQKNGFLVGYQAAASDSLNFDIENTTDIIIDETDSVSVEGRWQTQGSPDWIMSYNTIEINFKEQHNGMPEKEIKAFGIYEAFLQALRIITGKTDIFYSELLGRTDTPDPYAYDGFLLHIIRGEGIKKNTQMLPITFKDLFQVTNSILNVGIWYDTYERKIRLEDINIIFNNSIIADVSDRVNLESVEYEAAPDLVFKEIQGGYAKYSKDKENAIEEWNTKATYTTESKASNTTLKIRSKYRADGTTIERLASSTDFTTKEEGEDDVFVIKSRRNPNNNRLEIELGADFAEVTGTYLADQAINLGISPARNLRRWSNIIATGLYYTNKIRWQIIESNTKISSRYLNEANPVKEAEDIPVQDLGEQIMQAIRVKFKAALTASEIKSIIDNPHGLIVYSQTGASGWIDKLTVDNKEGICNFVLIKK